MEAESRILQDERFADLRSTPGVIRQAAFYHPTDPEGFLTRAQDAKSRLSTDERFAELSTTPHLFGMAAFAYPTDPDGFLAKQIARRRAVGDRSHRSVDDSGDTSPTGSRER